MEEKERKSGRERRERKDEERQRRQEEGKKRRRKEESRERRQYQLREGGIERGERTVGVVYTREKHRERLNFEGGNNICTV